VHATDEHALPVYHHRSGAGPTLVFLHYWGGSARTWGLVTDRLTDRDILTLDFRGGVAPVTSPARTRCTSSPTTRSPSWPTPESATTSSSVTRWAARSRSSSPQPAPPASADSSWSDPGPPPGGRDHARLPGRTLPRLRQRRVNSRGARPHPHRDSAQRRAQGTDRDGLPGQHRRRPQRMAAARHRRGRLRAHVDG